MTASPPDLIENKRENIAKQLRWKIYARDNFSCRYCGRKPPDAVLHIDHVKAVMRGGTNEEENLVTACQDCNLSKGANEIPAPRELKEGFFVSLDDVPKVTAITAEYPALGQKIMELFAEEARGYERKGHPVDVAMIVMVMATINCAAWVYFRLKESSKTKRDFMAMCATAFDEYKKAP